MKKIDLIALDLDGTALNPQNQVSPATADAVRRARESGIHVVVSTGRICGEARDFAPVSYTHLDVYKRQESRSGRTGRSASHSPAHPGCRKGTRACRFCRRTARQSGIC